MGIENEIAAKAANVFASPLIQPHRSVAIRDVERWIAEALATERRKALNDAIIACERYLATLKSAPGSGYAARCSQEIAELLKS